MWVAKSEKKVKKLIIIIFFEKGLKKLNFVYAIVNKNYVINNLSIG